MSNKKTLISLLLCIVTIGLSVSLWPHHAQAIGPLLPDSLIQQAECTSGCTLNTFVALGINVSNIILGLVGALTLLMFVYGGVTLLLSGGSAEKVSKGREIILGSVVGLCIVFGSFTIIQFVINKVLGATPEYQFTGNAPVDEAEHGILTAQQCKKSGGACIRDNMPCQNTYNQPGITLASDCSKNEKCCVVKDPPANTTCSHVAGNRCDGTGHCLPQETPDPLLLCPGGGLCCQGPPS